MRRVLGLSFVLVALIAAALPGPAAASSRPVVTVVPGTPAGASVTVAATVNRFPRQVASCIYGVDAAPSISCGAEASQDTSTAFTLILVDQEAGEHTIFVTVTLTDGGGATRSAGFTIEAPVASVQLTKTEDGESPSDVFAFELTGGPDNIDVTLTTKPGDGGLEWTSLTAGDYTLCERNMPATMHSSLEDAPYNGSREADGAGAVKVCVGITLSAGEALPIAVDNVHGPLAVAWTDLNGDHAYEAATDSLIARLADTNGDGVPSPGDTITTNRFPRLHDASAFEPATVTTFTVTSVPTADSGEIVVGTAAGLFAWISQEGLEQYQELQLGVGTITLVDGPAPLCDDITLEENSPSEIATPTGDGTCDEANDAFLDVAINIP